MQTATQIIDQAMQAGGNTRIQAWVLVQLNVILRAIYRKHSWPFLQPLDTSLSTTASQAYTSYATITDFWKPKVIQLLDGTTLNSVTPKPGGWTAYTADTSRLVSSARPSQYVLDRANSRIYWADSIPTAAETIHLTYQKEVADVALADTPTLLTHTVNGERYLYLRLFQEVKLYDQNFTEAAALGTLIRLAEDELMAERKEDEDETPMRHGNAEYV